MARPAKGRSPRVVEAGVTALHELQGDVDLVLTATPLSLTSAGMEPRTTGTEHCASPQYAQGQCMYACSVISGSYLTLTQGCPGSVS